MPTFDFTCSSHGKFEAYSRVGGTPTCPVCGSPSERVFAVGHLTYGGRPYDQSVDGRYPNRDKPREINRPGGGKARQTSTGGYRPMLTHSTICPKEKRWRNVAVLGAFPYGKRLACEACDYTWVYDGATTDRPLVNKVEEAYRPPRRIFMNPSVPLGGYVAPERGA